MDWEGSGSEQGWRKGPWTPEEDKLLSDYINLHGEGRWSSVSKYSGMFLLLYGILCYSDSTRSVQCMCPSIGIYSWNDLLGDNMYAIRTLTLVI